MAQTSLYPICKEFLVLRPKPLYYSLQHIFIWHEDFLELYKRLKITWLQAGSVCRMFAYLPFSVWRSFGPQLGAIWERTLCSGMMLSVSVTDVHSLVSVHRLEAFHSSLWIYFVVTWFEVTISFWFCPNRFATLHAIFKLCRSVICTLRSRSQMQCLA